MPRPSRDFPRMRRFAALILWIGLLLPSAASAADWGFFTGAHFGFSKEGQSVGDDYPGRSMGSLDLQAMPGVHFFNNAVLFGPLLDARLQSQLDTGTATSFNGFGLTVGPGFLFDFKAFRLLISWDWRDRQSISAPANATLAGSGFHFLLGIAVAPKVDFNIEFVLAKFNTLTIAGTEYPLTNNPVTQPLFGTGLSLTL